MVGSVFLSTVREMISLYLFPFVSWPHQATGCLKCYLMIDLALFPHWATEDPNVPLSQFPVAFRCVLFLAAKLI